MGPRFDLARLCAHRWFGYGVLLLLCALMFGDVLLAGSSVVLGDASRDSSTDMFHEFLSLRAFGFGELAQGRLALWNPHVFGGAPFFGAFQAALLYPPNWIFLVLPLALAINTSIALHTFCMGATLLAWARQRGLGPVAALLAGVMGMFGGSFFLQIYAGHLSNLCAMVWAPLVFMALDGLAPPAGQAAPVGRQRLPWVLLGSAALGLQMLAGHPQYVYYTGLAAGLYGALRLAGQKGRGPLALAMLAIPVGGLLLAAVQILAGLQATAETLRSIPLTEDFAARFSLTPESLLTAFAPWVLGKLSHTQYFGRWYLWEMSVFMGVSGCLLALSGAWQALRPQRCAIPSTQAREMRLLLAMVPLLLWLALGANTPLFALLFHYLPGFDRFRGTAKFAFFACLFGALLAASAYDHLARAAHAASSAASLEPSHAPDPAARFGARFETGAAWALAILLLGALLLSSQVDWLALIRRLHATGQTYLPYDLFSNPQSAPLRQATAAYARDTVQLALFKACLTALAMGLLWLWIRKKPQAVGAIAALLVLELFLFAAQARETQSTADAQGQQVTQFVAAHPGDYRIANANNPSLAMANGAQDVLGNDASSLLRYAEFMAFSQGHNPDHPTQYLDTPQDLPLYALLRLRYRFSVYRDGSVQVAQTAHELPHVALLTHYQVLAQRDAIFQALAAPGFDPQQQLVLEQAPVPEPRPDATGSVRVVASTSDTLDIEAELQAPALLLVSDTYSPYWQAEALPGSVQRAYTVLPADYILRAIPLERGHHSLRMRYLPTAFWPGVWISGLALLAWLLALAWWLRRSPAATDRGLGPGRRL